MMYTLEPSDTSPAQLDAGALTVGFAAPTALTQFLRLTAFTSPFYR
jgi:hypothetical protein